MAGSTTRQTARVPTGGKAPLKKLDAMARGASASAAKKAASGGEKTRAKKKKRTGREYADYIYRTMRQVDPNIQITSKAMAAMNKLIMAVLGDLMKEYRDLAHNRTSGQTMTANNIINCVRLYLPNGLQANAISEIQKAIANYRAAYPSKPKAAK